MLQSLAIVICTIFLIAPSVSFAQQTKAAIDKSKIPSEGTDAKEFVPPEWSIEEQVAGDLNGDGLPDLALKLIQVAREVNEDTPIERQRALVILFKGKDGKLHRAAVADKLLQCTSCGGAFYGVSPAPANVKIDKGVLIVNQDHGSRNVVEQTFRFRYEPAIEKFALIGLDVTDRDRATGEVVAESTNFLTGRKIIKRSQHNKRLKRDVTKTTSGTVAKKRLTIEEVNSEEY